jgi:CHASE3 domain sensor protein
MGSLEFSKQLLTQAEVAVAPGVGYGEDGEGFVRIAMVENEQRLRQAARNIKRYLAETSGDEHTRLVAELRMLDRRMDIINWSIALCVACGIVVCLMVSMLFLMGSGREALETPIAASFIFAMLLLLAALIMFLAEVRLAIRTIHVPMELLEKG